MTAKEAKEKQDRIAQHYNLGWWYGTDCEKCCGIFPKLMMSGATSHEQCYYQCEVCGKRSEPCLMPWIARDKWNDHEYVQEEKQLSFL